MKRFLPLLICLLHLAVLTYLARQHFIGNYATETDFYHFYAPDAERLAVGQFPQNTFQGPGYPATLALLGKATGLSGDLFTVGKWLSVICAVLCGGLTFALFAQLFGCWVGIGAQLLVIVSGEFPQFSINAATDVFFLLICLATLVVFLNEKWPTHWRVIAAAALTGAAYLTRYNGLFLLLVCLLGILLLNLFAQSWRARLKLAALFIVVFIITAAPWLYANYKQHGSPLYNTNYLNIATEFYPELVAGKTNQDGTRVLAERFHSFGDVLLYNPRQLFTRYPVNLWESLRLSFKDSLVNQWVAWLAWLGVLLVLWERRSKAALLMLSAGALYLLLMALNHWETRYYFFVMVLYAGLAVYTVARLAMLARSRGRLPRLAYVVSPVFMVAVLFILSLLESQRDVQKFLASHPTEITAARDYLNGVGARGQRIVARKPHLPYLSRNEWVFFPPVQSLDELRAWLAENRIDYLAIGKRELKERKALTSLGDPEQAPPWLRAVWVNEEPPFILYQPALGAE
jgi:4-amino-4-deoxy-L-arabinose transferase-like glycosyltransferase